MGMERRGSRYYFYRSVRIGDRVEKRYGGGGKTGVAIAAFERVMQNRRLIGIENRKVNAERRKRVAARVRKWLAGINAAVGAALVAAGWHQHNREWRKKRGATMTNTAIEVRETWVGSELSAAAGSLDPSVANKAAKGDADTLQAVSAYLTGNTAAVALWGDLGRQLLVKLVKLYAGKSLVYQHAIVRFASDLRSRLAGSNPSALDWLLAERVVIAWAFVNWAELQYVGAVDRLNLKQGDYYLKRIDLANRTLLAAVRALAKVERRNLPDVLALVNVKLPDAETPSAGS